MTESHDTQSPSIDGEVLDVAAAAELLALTTKRTSNALELSTILYAILGGIVFPVGFGVIWLSVRHQDPYKGPSTGSIGVLYLLVLIVDVIALIAYRRSTKGLGGRFSRERKVLSAVGGTSLVAVYVIMGALAHAGVTNAVVYGIYPASVPLVVGGMIGAFSAASREDWTFFMASLAIICVGAGAAFAGPVNVWAVSGFGCGAVFFACAGIKFVQRRSR